MIPLVQDFAQPHANPIARRSLADAGKQDGQSPSSEAEFRREIDQKDSNRSEQEKTRQGPVQKLPVNDADQTDQIGNTPSDRPSRKAGAEHAKADSEKDHAAAAQPAPAEAQISTDFSDSVPGASAPIAPALPIGVNVSQANGQPATGPSEGAEGEKGGVPIGDATNGVLTAAAPINAGQGGAAPDAASPSVPAAGTVVTEAKSAVPLASPSPGSPQPPSQFGTGSAVARAPSEHDEARRDRAEGREVPVPARAGTQTAGAMSGPQAATPQSPPNDPLPGVARQSRDFANSGAFSMLDLDPATEHRGLQRDGATGGPAVAHPFTVSAGPPPLSGLTAALVPGLSRQIVAALTRSPDGAVDLTLSPEELGRVRLSLSPTDAGGIIVHVSADRAETMDMIRRHIDTLAQDFRAIGYGSVAFGFSDSPRGGGGQDDAPASSHGSIAAVVPVPEIVLTSTDSTGLDLRL